MSFLKKVFKKITKPKAGGSLVGNILRGAVNKATGGILGNGAMLKAGLAAKAEEKAKAQSEALKADLQKTVQAAVKGAMATKESKPIADNGLKVGIAHYWEKYKTHIAVALGIIGLFFGYKGTQIAVKKYGSWKK